ncbi:MAG: hypothetical protein SNJ55_08745 [Chloroherpetonaceae bacterium]
MQTLQNTSHLPPLLLLSEHAQATLGRIGVERFHEFSQYPKGWKDGDELGEPLSYDSLQTLERFLAKFERFGKFPPSLFFSTSGNLQLAWKTRGENVIELEFLPNGIAALLPDDDDSRFFSNEHLNRLIEELESVV